MLRQLDRDERFKAYALTLNRRRSYLEDEPSWEISVVLPGRTDPKLVAQLASFAERNGFEAMPNPLGIIELSVRGEWE